MSNVKLQASASGTGTVTIAPPVTNSDLTINLPANSGTVPTIASVVNNGVVYTNSTGAITSSSALTFDGTNLGVGTSSPATKVYASVSGSGTIFDGFGATNGTATFRLGTTGASYSYAGVGANETWLYSAGNYALTLGPDGAAPIKFVTNGSERLRLDSSGNLGLGVTPSGWATYKSFDLGSYGYISSGGAGWMELMDNVYWNSGYKYKSNGYASHYLQQNSAHIWYTAPSGTAGNAISFTQAMTLDASGRLGVGTTSPAQRIHAVGSGEDQAEIQSQNTSTASNSRGTMRVRSATSTFGGGLMMTNGTDGSYPISSLCLYNYDNQPLVFGTNNTERARITSGGDLLVGTTTSYGKITSQQTDGTYSTSGLTIKRSANTNRWGFLIASDNNLYFGYNESDRGYFNSSTGAYTSVSDQRLKKNITDIQYGLNAVLALRSVSYNMDEQEDGDTKSLGFIAQEAMEIIPESVTKMMSGMYGMDKVALVPVLVKAIQELNAKVESLTTELNALKGT